MHITVLARDYIYSLNLLEIALNFSEASSGLAEKDGSAFSHVDR